MPLCEKCHQNEVTPQLLLEVQTLHLREFSGEKRIQALGNFVEAGVCEECVHRYMETGGRPEVPLIKSALLALLLTAVGVTVLLLSKGEGIPLFGWAALACAAALLWSSIRTYRARRAELAAADERERQKQAGWELLVSSLPQKYQDSNLTYIPVTADLQKRSIQELVSAYDLMPAIAQKAKELTAQRLGIQSPSARK